MNYNPPVGIYPRYWLAGYIDILHSIAASAPKDAEKLDEFNEKTHAFFLLIASLVPNDRYRAIAEEAVKGMPIDGNVWEKVFRMTRPFTSFVVGDKRRDYQNDPFGEASVMTFSREEAKIKAYYSKVAVAAGDDGGRPGISPKLWKRFWGFLHSLAADYPMQDRHAASIKQSNGQSLAQNVLSFIKLLPDVLPCSICRDSLRKYLSVNPPDAFIINRMRLVDYFYDLHEDVNKRKRLQATRSDILLRRYLPYSRYKLYENNEYIHSDYEFLSSFEEKKDDFDFY